MRFIARGINLNHFDPKIQLFLDILITANNQYILNRAIIASEALREMGQIDTIPLCFGCFTVILIQIDQDLGTSSLPISMLNNLMAI